MFIFEVFAYLFKVKSKIPDFERETLCDQAPKAHRFFPVQPETRKLNYISECDYKTA